MTSNLWQDILASYTPEKRKWEKKYPYDYYVLRPLSFPLTWLAAKAGFTPNQVTFITVIISLAGCFFLAQGTRDGLIIGGLLVSFFNLVDCIDGNLARMKPGSSKRGAFLDSIAGYPYRGAYLAAGMGLYRMDGEMMFLWFGMAAFSLELISVNLEFCYTYFSLLSAKSPSGSHPATGGNNGGTSGITGTPVYKVYRNFVDLIAHDFLFPLTAFTGHIGLFLAASAVIKFIDFSVSLLYFIVRSKNWEKELI